MSNTFSNRKELDVSATATSTATASIETPSDALPISTTEEEELEKGHAKSPGLTLAHVMNSMSTKQSVMLQIDSDILERISNMDGDSDDGSDVRESDLCCFWCCDLVKACIIMNSIFMVLMVTILSLAIYRVPTFDWFDLCQSDDLTFDSYYEQAQDDYFYERFITKSPVTRKAFWSLVRSGVAIPFAAIGVIGATKFHQTMVLCTAIWYCIYIIWSGFDRMIAYVVVGMLFAYPNFHLYFELRKGKISRKMYWREKYCFCDLCGGNPDYLMD